MSGLRSVSLMVMWLPMVAASCARSIDANPGDEERDGGSGAKVRGGDAVAGSTGATDAAAGTPASGQPGERVQSPTTLADLPVPRAAIEIDPGAVPPAGLWVGELRRPSKEPHPINGAYYCETTSPRIALQIAVDDDGVATGVVVFGDMQWTPPPPTMPLEAWPPGDDMLVSSCRRAWPSAGYPFSVLEGVASAARLTFHISPNELYAPWCALQHSHPEDFGASDPRYNCLPEMTTEELRSCREQDASGCPVALLAFDLCGGFLERPCVCLVDGCRAQLEAGYGLNLRIEGETMSGLMSAAEGEAIEVRLLRVE